ncbi:MAG TPA: response regulator [Ktedonobacterales bacterium]
MAIRVLVVNDTQEILDIFRDILQDEGYEVVLYSYTIEEMAEVERIAPDLIILDYVFGYEKAGWQMLQKLKMTRATENTPIIVCTAATREVRDIQGYLQAHGIRLLPKPFDIDELLITVKLALQDPQHDALFVTHREQERREQGPAEARSAACDTAPEADGKEPESKQRAHDQEPSSD